jgi:hypothetical protein
MFGTSTISNSLEGCQIQATPIALALDPSWSQDRCGIRACPEAGRAREPLGSLQPDRYGRLRSTRYGGVAQPHRGRWRQRVATGGYNCLLRPKPTPEFLAARVLPCNSTSLSAC